MSENCETCKNQRVLYYYGEVCICADCSDDMKLSDYIKQLQEENKLLRETLQKYTHEEVRGIYIKEFLIRGHNYDSSCFACTEYNKGELARKTLAEIDKCNKPMSKDESDIGN